MQNGDVKAFAHITGGGLLENIPRILPDGLRVRLDAHKWKMNPVFGWLAEKVMSTMLLTHTCTDSFCLPHRKTTSEEPYALAICLLSIESHHEKTCLRGLRPSKTQTSLLS